MDKCAVVIIFSVSLAVLGGVLAAQARKESPVARFQLASPAFLEGQAVPARHTCDGPDVSPRLTWSGAPAAVKAFALVCDDPDAPGGVWVHWVIFNIPATATELPENIPKVGELADGSRQGTNDFQRPGYNGPCPPAGPAHRYVFRLYALSGRLELPSGVTKAEVLRAAGGRVLAAAQLTGRYQRRF